MKKFIFVLLINFLFRQINVYANAGDSINLVKNGSFEMGNEGFESDFVFSQYSVQPGEYSITKKASLLNPDFVNAKSGDHTSGMGRYMIINANGYKGQKVWRYKVSIIPNSNYNFSVFFCNLYKNKGNDQGFAINGMPVSGTPKGNFPNLKVTINKQTIIENERDIFHNFSWIRAEALWYSGKDSGQVEITIENLNPKIDGNDLALDDIKFFYINTMPVGYTPPINHTELWEAYRELEAEKSRKDPRGVIAINNLAKGDSVSPGFFAITRKPSTSPDYSVKPSKIDFSNILFEQSKSDLTPEAVIALTNLLDYLKKNPTLRILLKGHTDNIGNPALNLKLSEDRALQIKTFLTQRALEESRISIESFGGAKPLENSSLEELRKLNRRVEIELIGK